MVIHYSASPENVACGRTGPSLNSTSDAARVSCKLCLRSVEKKAAAPVRKTPSLAELRAAAKSAKAASETAKPHCAMTPRAEWQQRLERLPGRNRLPRGVSRQSFI
ncbi:hypothetical protein [Pseudomonas lopnurensis]|uniref:hypothetical protein n=1 Tax=Pseudomonas lopnurensis TaxID=1477517 RepID=UPI0028B1D255|nr:hypothetical protein [Pseudomonas lopnurensis]